jgi:hypothetical protein
LVVVTSRPARNGGCHETLASLVTAALIASVVPAAHAKPRPRDGIAHAKAAGITIIVWEGRTTFTLDDEYAVRRDGEKLGEQRGDFTPLLIELDGERHVIVAGVSLDSRTRHVQVHERSTPVNPEAAERPWMTPPLPFSPGMTITVMGKATPDGDELWRLESPPLTEDRPEPVFGPGWTRYSPLTS